jgi:hypothetical protein
MKLSFFPQVLYISGVLHSCIIDIQLTLLVVQTMSHVVADGKSNWLEGLILICEFASLHSWEGVRAENSLGKASTLSSLLHFGSILVCIELFSYLYTMFIMFVGSGLTSSIGRCDG